MYRYFRDFCAIITSAITLYDGLATQRGIVASYGDGIYVHSLHKYGSIHSRSDVVSMLEKDAQTQLDIKQFMSGPIYAYVCTPKSGGLKGLKDYLKDLGFLESDHQEEIKAAKSYFEELQDPGLSSRTRLLQISGSNFVPLVGRKLVSAISTRQLSLSGRFRCACTPNFRADHNLRADLPPVLGDLDIKSTVKLGNFKEGLVYINGKLRILKTNLRPVSPFKMPVWEPRPKFDSIQNHGLLLREDIEFFMYLYYDYQGVEKEDDIEQHVLLGCYEVID